MFEAWVAFCLLSNPNECAMAQDTWGPYKTMEECEQRALDMAESLYLLPDHLPVAWHCKPPGEPV
jgi:hypothetical protein